MTPEERVKQLVNEHWDVVASQHEPVIVATIRAAVNDALERAAITVSAIPCIANDEPSFYVAIGCAVNTLRALRHP